jgi:hypothetical protein
MIKVLGGRTTMVLKRYLTPRKKYLGQNMVDFIEIVS